MEDERAGGAWIAEVHANLPAVIRMSVALPVRNFDCVAQILIRNELAINFEQLEVDLMDMKHVCFQGPILDRPILHCSDVRCDRRIFIGLKHFLFLAIDRDVKLDRPIRATEFLGEEQFSLCGGRLVQ